MKRQATMRQHGRLLTLLRYAWASPCSLVGLLLAVPILLEVGKEPVYGEARDLAIAEEAERLMREIDEDLAFA